MPSPQVRIALAPRYPTASYPTTSYPRAVNILTQMLSSCRSLRAGDVFGPFTMSKSSTSNSCVLYSDLRHEFDEFVSIWIHTYKESIEQLARDADIQAKFDEICIIQMAPYAPDQKQTKMYFGDKYPILSQVSYPQSGSLHTPPLCNLLRLLHLHHLHVLHHLHFLRLCQLIHLPHLPSPPHLDLTFTSLTSTTQLVPIQIEKGLPAASQRCRHVSHIILSKWPTLCGRLVSSVREHANPVVDEDDEVDLGYDEGEDGIDLDAEKGGGDGGGTPGK